jgi:hypothetical protein
LVLHNKSFEYEAKEEVGSININSYMPKSDKILSILGDIRQNNLRTEISLPKIKPV